MTVKCTSKASYLTTKETNEKTQKRNIMEIVNIGGDFTIQELMAAYEVRWGAKIDSGAMSGRMNSLREKDNLLKLAPPRKCPISKRTVNPVTANICTHDKYKGNGFMFSPNALKAMGRGDIIWMGMVVAECECGADISHARRVPVMTFEQWQGANK